MSTVLALPVLELNRNWIPIRVTTVRKAMRKLFEGHARVVDGDYTVYDFDSWASLDVMKDAPCLHTTRSCIRIPDVIVAVRYGEIPNRQLAFSRLNIYKRDKDTCQYCGKRPGRGELTIDHIVPRARGGTSTWTNCVLACLKCNHLKADKTPAEAGLRLRRAPIKPDWHPRLIISRVPNTPANWEKFVNSAYWNTELKP